MTVALDDETRFGAWLDKDTGVFRLWAPGAKTVKLAIERRKAMALARDADGFWTGRAAARAGALYRFEVDGRLVPDPASRFQPYDVGGPSELLDPSAYAWRHAGWAGRPWRETVLYELHVGLMGGFQGVRSRLEELAALGVTAIELMPIADFAGVRNWGYDGVLSFAPDSAYGRPDDLRALIDAAHGLGLMVFLDVVYNHFGPEGNWLPSYAPEMFDEARHTPWGAAIDFHKAPVRRFFIENALYWLEDFRFDGLRLDAVHAILDRSWLVELAQAVRRRIPHRRVHLVVENENNDAALLGQGFDAQWNDDFHNVLHVLLTGETHAYYRDFADRPAERLARCLAEGFVYQGEPSPNHDGRPRGQPSGDVRPTAFVSFLQNHDQVGNRAFGERLTQLADPQALKAAMALLLLSPQIPLLFTGEEAGAREPFLFFTDFHGGLAASVREGRRREFRNQPEFADAAMRQRIPDPNAITTFTASRWTTEAPDAEDWRNWVRVLLEIRRARLVPHLDGCTAIGAVVLADKAVLARWRLADGARLTIAINLGATIVPADLPSGAPLIGGHPGAEIPSFTTLAWIEP
jgi:maltooligosyltrehalose trehalohydrolase